MPPILKLPVDIHFEIIKYLDPVDSACYGLASRMIYPAHRKIHGSVHMWHKWRSGTFHFGQQDLFDRLSRWMIEAGYVWAPLLSAKSKGRNGTAKGWVPRGTLTFQELEKAEPTPILLPKEKVPRYQSRLRDWSQDLDSTWKGSSGSENVFWREYVSPQHPSKDKDVDNDE